MLDCALRTSIMYKSICHYSTVVEIRGENAKLHHVLLTMCCEAHCFIHGWQEHRWTTGCLWHPELSLSRIYMKDLHQCLLSVPLIKMRLVSSLPGDIQCAHPRLNLSNTVVAGFAGYSVRTIMKLAPIFSLIMWYYSWHRHSHDCFCHLILSMTLSDATAKLLLLVTLKLVSYL